MPLKTTHATTDLDTLVTTENHISPIKISSNVQDYLRKNPELEKIAFLLGSKNHEGISDYTRRVTLEKIAQLEKQFFAMFKEVDDEDEKIDMIARLWKGIGIVKKSVEIRNKMRLTMMVAMDS